MTVTDIPDYYNDLDGSLAVAWGLIRDGATDRRHPLHTPTIGYVDADGMPSVCTVVLRDADPETRALRFNTDRRARKADRFDGAGALAVGLYDPGAKVQLRLSCDAVLHTDDAVADAAWAASARSSRECYRQSQHSAHPLDDPEILGTWEDDFDGRENFATVTATVRTMEWLYLSAAGHRRALYDWTGDGLSAGWIAP